MENFKYYRAYDIYGGDIKYTLIDDYGKSRVINTR